MLHVSAVVVHANDDSSKIGIVNIYENANQIKSFVYRTLFTFNAHQRKGGNCQKSAYNAAIGVHNQKDKKLFTK